MTAALSDNQLIFLYFVYKSIRFVNTSAPIALLITF